MVYERLESNDEELILQDNQDMTRRPRAASLKCTIVCIACAVYRVCIITFIILVVSDDTFRRKRSTVRVFTKRVKCIDFESMSYTSVLLDIDIV